jgi:preprotein translocase subunit SecG
MYTAVMILHLIVCLFLIFIILIQSSKGAEMGAAFGGSNQTLFGSRGAATFLSKMTTVAAVVFMLTSLSLAILTIKSGSVVSSLPTQEAPVKTLEDAPKGPMQDQPLSPGQGEVKDAPVQPADTKQ